MVDFLETRHLHGDANVARAKLVEDGAAGIGGNLRRKEDAGFVAREMLDEEGGDVRGGVGNRRGDHAAATKLIESGDRCIPADEDGLIVLGAADEDGGGEAGVFENAATNQARDLARSGSLGEALVDEALRAIEAAAAMPAAKLFDVAAADLGVHFAELDGGGNGADFILRSEIDGDFADGRRKTEFLALAEFLAESEMAITIDARTRDGFVESDVGRPGGNGVAAFGGFVKANVDGVDGVEKLGAAAGEKVGEAGSDAGVDDRRAIFLDEAAMIGELLGLEWIARKARIEVNVVRAKAQGGAKDGLVERGGSAIGEQVATARSANDGPDIASVGFDDFDGVFLAEKAAGTFDIAIAAPDRMALAREKFSEKGARAAHAENEDAHRGKTVSQAVRGAGADMGRVCCVGKWVSLNFDSLRHSPENSNCLAFLGTDDLAAAGESA